MSRCESVQQHFERRIARLLALLAALHLDADIAHAKPKAGLADLFPDLPDLFGDGLQRPTPAVRDRVAVRPSTCNGPRAERKSTYYADGHAGQHGRACLSRDGGRRARFGRAARARV